jgi:hypothetical protein
LHRLSDELEEFLALLGTEAIDGQFAFHHLREQRVDADSLLGLAGEAI